MSIARAYVHKPAPERLLPKKGSNNVETLVSIVETGWKTYNIGKEWYRRKFSYMINITEKDAIYQEVMDWLLAVTPFEKHRSLKVSASSKKNYGEESDIAGPGETKTIEPLKISFNDNAVRNILIEGHKVEVSVYTPDADGKSDTYLMRYEMEKEINFRCFSYEAQQAIIRQLEKLNQKRATTRKARLMMMNQWGSWRSRSDLPPRTMQSVNMPAEQKERIVEDLDGFLKAEDTYNRLAIPWHRGYMFYGPPGTGKTSLVKALANEFNLDLWYISLADLKAETSLLGLLSEVGPRSMLLLEDIDTIKITHDRDSSDPGSISMGSLLNTLDGVATPHGLITVMTTNRFDILDPALTRAGRMDLIEELAYPTKSTVREMYQYFFDGAYETFAGIKDNEFVEKQISTSQIAEVFKRNMDDPKGAYRDLKDLVKDQRLPEGS